MTVKKHISFLVTEEERVWVHNISKANNTSIPTMLIEFLDNKSKELGIPLPKMRINRTKHAHPYTTKGTHSRDKFMARIDEELGLK